MVEEEGRVVHVLSEPVAADSEVECEIDWVRRFDHMQQHTGQHLLSAVFADLYGIQTVSFHMGAASSTIDLRARLDAATDRRPLKRGRTRIVQENRAVSVTFEDAAAAQVCASHPTDTGPPAHHRDRLISIGARAAAPTFGSTGEIGAILLRSTDRFAGMFGSSFYAATGL